MVDDIFEPFMEMHQSHAELVYLFGYGKGSELSRPSVSSAMIINPNETNITESIEKCVVNGIIDSKKHFRKLI